MEYNTFLDYIEKNDFVGDGFIYDKKIDNITLRCHFKQSDIVFGIMYNELYYATITKDIEHIPNVTAINLIYNDIIDELLKTVATKLKQQIKLS